MASIGDAIKAARLAKQGFQAPPPMAPHQQIAPPPQYMQPPMPPGPQINYMMPPPPPPPPAAPSGPMSIADQIRAAKLAKSGGAPPPPPGPPQQFMQQPPMIQQQMMQPQMMQQQMMPQQMMQAPPPPPPAPPGPAKPMSIADQIRQNRMAKQGPPEPQAPPPMMMQPPQQQFMQQPQFMQPQMMQPQAPQMPSLPSAIAEQLARQQASQPQQPAVNKNQSIADQIRAARLGKQGPQATAQAPPQPAMQQQQQYAPQPNMYAAPPPQQQPQQQYAPPQQQYQQPPPQQQYQQAPPQQQYQQPQFQQQPPPQQQQFQQPQFQQQQFQQQPQFQQPPQQPQFQQQQFQQQMYQAPSQPQSNLPPALAAVLDVTAAHGIFSDSDLELFGDYIIMYENKATELTVRKKMVADGFPPADITTFFKNYRAYKKNETASNKGAAKGNNLTPQQMNSMPGQENSVEAMAKYTKMKESNVSEMLIRDTMAMDGYSKPEIDAFFEFEKKVKEEAAALSAAAKAAAAVAPKHHPPAAWMTPEAQAPVVDQQMPPWMQQQQMQQQQMQQQQNESPFAKAQNKFGKQQQQAPWQQPQAQNEQEPGKGRPMPKKVEPSAAIKALFGNKDTKKVAKEEEPANGFGRAKKEKVAVSDAVASLFGSRVKASAGDDEDDEPVKPKKSAGGAKKAAKVSSDDEDDAAPPRRGKAAFDKENFAKYIKMRGMKLPDGAIRQKMIMDGLSDKDQDTFFAWDGTDGGDDDDAPKPKAKKGPKKVKLDEEKYGKYMKMQKMNMPEGAIRQKMVMDGLSGKDQDAFFAAGGDDGADEDDDQGEDEEEDAPTKKPKSKRAQADEDMYGRYFRMRKMNLPDDAIKAKMKVDGLSQGEMRRFFDGEVEEPDFSGAAAAKVVKAMKAKPAPAEVDEEEEVEVKKPKKLAASNAVASLFGAKAKNSDEAEEVEEKKPKKLAASNAVAALFGAKAKDSDEAEEVEVKKPKKLAASNAVAALFGAKAKNSDEAEEEVEVKKPKKKVVEEEADSTPRRSPDDEELFAKYIKMESMKLPEGAIRQKMVMDGLSARDQDRFFKGSGAPEKAPAPSKATTTIRVQKQDLDDEYHLEERFTKYVNMQRNLSPEYAIRQKMTNDGLSSAEITRFFQSSKRASISTAHGDDHHHDHRASDTSRHSVDYTDSRFVKFTKLHKSGTSENVIRQKMVNDGFTNGEITSFFFSLKRASASSVHSSEEAAPSMRSSMASVYANDEKYAKYVKMHKMMAAETSIRQRMTMDGFSSGDIGAFLTAMRKHSSHASAEVETDRASSFIDSQVDEKYSRYAKMHRMGSPEVAVRQKMILDGFGQPEINKFFADFKERMSVSARETPKADNSHSRPQKVKVPDTVSSLFGSKHQERDDDADERPQPKKTVKKAPVEDDEEAKPAKTSKAPATAEDDEKDKYIKMLRDELGQDVIRQRMRADGFSDEDVDTFFEYSSYALAAAKPKPTPKPVEQAAKPVDLEPKEQKPADDDDSSEVSSFGFIRPRYRAGLLPPCEDTGVQPSKPGEDSAAPVRIIGNANTERRIVKKRGNSDELVITVVLPIQTKFPNPKYEKPKLLSDGIVGNPSDVTDSSDKESGIISPARLLLNSLSLRKAETTKAPKETGVWPYAAFKSTSRLSDNTEINATFAALTDEFSADADYETSPFEATKITSRISIKARDPDTETDAGTDIDVVPVSVPETTFEESSSEFNDGTQRVHFSSQILTEDEGTQTPSRAVIKPGVKKSALKSKAASPSDEPPKNKFQKYSEMFDSGMPADQLRREMRNDGTPIELINQFFEAKVPKQRGPGPLRAAPAQSRRPQGDQYIKYRTMLKVNLPREVVQARMATDGFSPLEIMYFFRSLGPGYVDPYTRWLSQKALDSIPSPRNSLPAHVVHSPRALSQYPPDDSADSRNAYFAKTLLDAEKKIRDVSMTKLSKKERQRRLDKEREAKKHDRLKVIHNSRVNACYYVWGDAPVNVVPPSEEPWTPTLLSPTQVRMRRSSSADALFGRVMGQLKVFSPSSPKSNSSSRNAPYQQYQNRPRDW